MGDDVPIGGSNASGGPSAPPPRSRSGARRAVAGGGRDSPSTAAGDDAHVGADVDTGVSMPTRPDWRRPSVAWLRDWIIWFGPWRLVATAVAVVGVAIAGWWLVRPPHQPTEASLPMASAASVPSTVTTAASPTTTVVASAPAGDAVAAAPGEPAVDAGTARPEAPPGSTVSSSTVVVHVAGAVRTPGVYELPVSARLDDAIAEAGGFGPRADPDALNLAAPVVDGSQIYVPRPDEVQSSVPVAAPSVSVPAVGAAAPGMPAGEGEMSAGSAATSSGGPIDLNAATVDELETLPGIGPATGQAIVDHREANGPFLSVDELEDVRGIGPAKLDAVRDLVTV